MINGFDPPAPWPDTRYAGRHRRLLLWPADSPAGCCAAWRFDREVGRPHRPSARQRLGQPACRLDPCPARPACRPATSGWLESQPAGWLAVRLAGRRFVSPAGRLDFRLAARPAVRLVGRLAGHRNGRLSCRRSAWPRCRPQCWPALLSSLFLLGPLLCSHAMASAFSLTRLISDLRCLRSEF